MDIQVNDEMWLSVAEQRTQEHLRAARVHHLLNQNGQGQQTKLTRQTGRLLRGVGTQLVALGEQLEGRQTLTVALPKETEVICDPRIA